MSKPNSMFGDVYDIDGDSICVRFPRASTAPWGVVVELCIPNEHDENVSFWCGNRDQLRELIEVLQAFDAALGLEAKS